MRTIIRDKREDRANKVPDARTIEVYDIQRNSGAPNHKNILTVGFEVEDEEVEDIIENDLKNERSGDKVHSNDEPD